ncbi:MAG: ABC transporter permease [Chlamydiota bacterium]
MWSRLKQLIVKEFIHVLRDKRARAVLFVPPVVQMLVFGYAATFQVRHVATVVLDRDQSQESRDFVSRLASNRYFDLRRQLTHEAEIREAIDRKQAVVAVQIHPGFARLLRKGAGAPVQVVVDATNSNTAMVALSYLNQIGAQFAEDYQRDRMWRLVPQLAAVYPNVELEPRPWYNPDLNSHWFFVPGIIGSLTLVMITLLTAFAVVREREIGTLEQIMVTPIRASEFILGKTIPFFLIGLLDIVFIALVGTLWFAVPFRGSVAVLALGSVLFLLCLLGIGLLISTVCTTQQQAMVTSFFFSMPAVTFSGFGFPVSSMPPVMQSLTYLNPLRHFLVILRSVYLKGVSLEVLWPQMLVLLLTAAVVLTASVLRFRKSLD